MQAYVEKIEPHPLMGGGSGICLKIFFSGCNFKCPYCNVPEMLFHTEEKLLDIKEIKNTIKQNYGSIKEVVFTGGEPLIQRHALVNIASYCKAAGLKTRIETNASKPFCIKEILESSLIDTIVIDLKAPFDPDVFKKITKCETYFVNADSIINNIKQSLEIIKQYRNKINIAFKTVLVPGLLFRKDDIEQIATVVNDMEAAWILQGFDNKGPLQDKLLEGINRPSDDFINNIKEHCSKLYPELFIEVEK